MDTEKPVWLVNREKLAEKWRENMTQGVSELIDTSRLHDFVEGAVAMPGRSVGNTLLVLNQFKKLRETGLVDAPLPSLCLGYREWLARGYQVRKNQEGMKILRPVTSRLVPSGEKNETGSEKMRVLRASENPPAGVTPKIKVFGFQACTVFDISQTIGGHAPTRPPAPKPTQMVEAVAEEARKLGYQVHFNGDKEMEERLVSSSLPALTLPEEKLILVRHAEDTRQVEALIHELGHITMGHAGQHSTRREKKEVEAEIVAGFLNTAYGLNPWPASGNYDPSWAGKDRIVETIGKTLDTARQKAAKHSTGIAHTLSIDDPLKPVKLPLVEPRRSSHHPHETQTIIPSLPAAPALPEVIGM